MTWFFATALAQSLPVVSWDWSQEHRFFIEAEVQLSQRLWFEAEFNKGVRAVGWQIQTVLSCKGTGEQGAAREEVLCTIEDIGIRAATVLGDQGRALPVLEEYDQVLTGAPIKLDFRSDGRMVHYEIRLKSGNLRTRGRNQTLRLMLRSIVAGLEIQLPQKGSSPWLFRQTQLCQLPTLWGTLAPVDGIATGKIREGTVLEIASSARGLMSPGDNENLVTCNTTERAFFTVGRGLARHTWEMEGDMTPGSPGALGITTIPYTQRGQLYRLAPGEQPDVVVTQEYVPNLIPSGAFSGGAPPPSRIGRMPQ